MPNTPAPLTTEAASPAGATTYAGSQRRPRAASSPSAPASITPAASPTTAASSAGARTTSQGLNAIEDAIAAQLPSGELARSAQTNRTALANALRDIAGTPDELAQLITQRGTTADTLYGQARAEGIDLATLEPQAQANIAAFQQRIPEDVLARARELAGIRGVNMGNESSIQGMHWVKKAIDSKIGQAVRAGDNEMALAYQGLQRDLIEGMAQISSTYDLARQTFQQMSEPINQRQIGEALANKLIPATSGDIPASLNPASLARSMQDPDALARAATGFQGSQMASVLTPQQMTTVQGVTSDASRMAEALKRGAGTGSATARRLAQGDMIAQHITSEAPVISRLLELSSQVPGLNMATRGLSGLASVATSGQNARVLAQLDEMLATDPAGVARLVDQELARVPPTQRQQIIRNLPQSVLMAMPAIANAQQ